ncbi:hypothetical protein PARHAE_03249 [Paracoccus haematequi]|uniref:Uncharacterized protein n=1 Tax=Paracoccus haematequi TaxID=2491866 RepID=A0A447IRC7_9RHOB|nr:hypothetical protein [Paracoccus haematequi]VDS10038.1 hypothetical protein PARHAE_03249 [Paracoccus haematequi]
MRYSELKLNGQPLLPGADRNVAVSVTPISQATNLRRTVNGELINVARDVYRKLRVTISGRGRRSPAFSDMFPGDDMTVQLPDPLFYAGADIGRTVIEKAGVLEDCSEIRVPPGAPFAQPVAAVGYILLLECKITGLSVQVDEWKKDYTWNLELEEK